MGLKGLSVGFAAAGGVAGVTMAVSAWAVQTWASPLTPTLYMASAVLLLTLGAGAMWYSASRDELERGIGAEGQSAEERAFKRLAGVLTIPGIAVLGLGFVSLWNFPIVRSFVLEQSLDRGPVWVGQALADPSSEVRQSACSAMFQMDMRGFERPLVAMMSQDPQAAVACLENAQAQERSGVAGIARKVLSGWRLRMLESPKGFDDVTCSLPPAVLTLSDYDDGLGEARLMECAIGAESAKVQACCAAQLKTRDGALARMMNADAYPELSEAGVFRNLIRASFRPLSLEVESQAVMSDLGLSDEARRRELVKMGCELVYRPHIGREIVKGFVPIMEGQACGLSTETQALFAEPESWWFVCEELDRRTVSGTVEAEVCDVVRDRVVAKAVEVAEIRVGYAIKSPASGETIKQLTFGGGIVRQSLEEEQRRNDPYDASNIKVLDFYPDSYKRRGRVCYKYETDQVTFDDVNRRTPSDFLKKRLSQDCDPGIDDTMTVEELDKRNKGRMKRTLSGADKTTGKKLREKYGDARVRQAQKKTQKELSKVRKQ